MADFVYVCIVLLIGFTHIKISTAGGCNDFWDISADENGQVRWFGVDRDAFMDIRVEADDALSSECSVTSKLGILFNAREVHFKPPCPISKYQVSVTLVCNKNETSTRIMRFSVPYEDLIPEHVRVIATTNTSIILQWNKPTSYNDSVVTYSVELVSTNSEATFVQNTSDVFCSFRNLMPYTLYSVRVRAFTDDIDGNWTEPIKVRTEIGVPSQPSIQRASSNHDSIWVEWLKPEHLNGPNVTYIVIWKDGNVQLGSKKTNETSFRILGLKSFTHYIIQVCAVNGAGKGQCTDFVGFSTGGRGAISPLILIFAIAVPVAFLIFIVIPVIIEIKKRGSKSPSYSKSARVPIPMSLSGIRR
ncbi:receptor-type tyrosine-protein phosphatase S-like [Stegodyphus dumicola]|uniref:receptor-type tyrosine-protein phosphatase S-like n=1 Tax=Stegodyphus dumicola TaxID=202533 RepID=UPI0015B03561|nr:receptor-type tyrosine-protein phosphatase S-like [Stegodyphus dumicola]